MALKRMQLECTKCNGKCCKTPINSFNVVLILKEIDKFKKFSRLLNIGNSKLYILKKDRQKKLYFLR